MRLIVMQNHFRSFLAIACLSATPLLAQNTGAGGPSATAASADSSADAQQILVATQFREAMAKGVASGAETAEAALARLGATAAPVGVNLDTESEFGFAAADVGYRLMVAHRREAAVVFFHQAEQTLEHLVQNTPDSAKQRKVMYLSNLAILRVRGLGKVAEARTDIAAALKLEPKSRYLQSLQSIAGSAPTIATSNSSHN